MVDFAREEKGDGIGLRLSGDLVIQHAAELSSFLTDALSDSDVVEIDVSAVEEVDISCLQLLCASHKMAMEFNKVLRFGGQWSGAFTETATEAYFLRHAGCLLDTKKECLWVKEFVDG